MFVCPAGNAVISAVGSGQAVSSFLAYGFECARSTIKAVLSYRCWSERGAGDPSGRSCRRRARGGVPSPVLDPARITDAASSLAARRGDAWSDDAVACPAAWRVRRCARQPRALAQGFLAARQERASRLEPDTSGFGVVHRGRRWRAGRGAPPAPVMRNIPSCAGDRPVPSKRPDIESRTNVSSGVSPRRVGLTRCHRLDERAETFILGAALIRRPRRCLRTRGSDAAPIARAHL